MIFQYKTLRWSIFLFISYDYTSIPDHEAQLYQGESPYYFVFGNTEINVLINEGNNCLAVEIHNVEITSSDMSSNFF